MGDTELLLPQPLPLQPLPDEPSVTELPLHPSVLDSQPLWMLLDSFTLQLSHTFMMPLVRFIPLLSLMFTFSPSLPCQLSHADMPVLPSPPQPSLPQQSDMLLPQPLPPQLSQLQLPLPEDTVMPAATAGLVPRVLELLPLA